MGYTETRRNKQKAFLKSKQNIIIGTLNHFPLKLDQLVNIENEKIFYQKIESGLTSFIYNIELDNHKYNLKIKRDKILVDNPDGETSFLNEVQRRFEFEDIRKTNKIIDRGIVKTVYANLNQGVILSEYIEGIHLTNYTKYDLTSLFDLLFELDINGFFEWDLCSGNILKENDRIVLFDFGYMYKFNPLQHFNSEGLKEPDFHPIERFETRHFLHVLRDMNETDSMRQYRLLKSLTKDYFIKKVRWLIINNADFEVINMYNEKITQIANIIENKDLMKQSFISDMYRATVMDIMDDISGKTCTIHTINKLEFVKTIIEHNYETLKETESLLNEEGLSKEDLIVKYNEISKLVLQYQID